MKRKDTVYSIHTDRLILRCWQPQDAKLLEEAIDTSLDHLNPWMPWVSQEPEDLQSKIERLRKFRGEFDLGIDFVYGVFNKQESQVLGGCGLHTRLGKHVREIGYWIRSDSINQGFATELSMALVKVAFNIDEVERVEIQCDPQNQASLAIPKKLKFNHEATLTKRAKGVDGKPRDTMIWTLFRENYPNTPASLAKITTFDVLDNQLF